MALRKRPAPTTEHSDMTSPDPSAIQALVEELADRPYGEAKPASASSPTIKHQRITLSLPIEMVEQLEKEAYENKRNKSGPTKISQLVQRELRKAGYAG